MSASFLSAFERVFDINKKRGYAFAVTAAGAVVLGLFPGKGALEALLQLAAIICALVFGIGVIITSAKSFYGMAKNVMKCGQPRSFYMDFFLSCTVMVLVCAIVTIPVAALSGAFTLPQITYSESDIAELSQMYGEENVTALTQAADALQDISALLTERGYSSPSFYITVCASSLLGMVSFIASLFTAITLARFWPAHPFITALSGFFAIDIIKSFCISLLTSLCAFAAPGLTYAAEKLNSLTTLTADTPAELVSALTARLPNADVFIKTAVYSSMCEVLWCVSAVLLGIFLLGLDLSPKSAK